MINESVYCLIRPQLQAAEKSPLYKSKHSNHGLPPTYSTFGYQGTSVVLGNVGGAIEEMETVHPAKKATGSFGKVVCQEVDPKTFLKKSNKGGGGSECHNTFTRPTTEALKAAVPKKGDKPVMGLKTEKDYVVANAVENILAVPKKSSPPQNRAVNIATYGAIPEYLSKRKEELYKHHASVAEAESKRCKDGELFRELPSFDVKALREQLKGRWEVLNKEFQTMGFNLETRTQIRRRETVERELRMVEAALAKINRERIFVFDDTR